jgi:hypothetical protein
MADMIVSLSSVAVFAFLTISKVQPSSDALQLRDTQRTEHFRVISLEGCRRACMYRVCRRFPFFFYMSVHVTAI